MNPALSDKGAYRELFCIILFSVNFTAETECEYRASSGSAQKGLNTGLNPVLLNRRSVQISLIGSFFENSYVSVGPILHIRPTSIRFLLLGTSLSLPETGDCISQNHELYSFVVAANGCQ